MNTKGTQTTDVQDFKYLIGMALQNKFSWKALGSLLDEMTSTLKKSKQVNKILLEQLRLLQWKTQNDEFEAGEVITKHEKSSTKIENGSKSGEDSIEDSGVLDEDDFENPDYNYEENYDENSDDTEQKAILDESNLEKDEISTNLTFDKKIKADTHENSEENVESVKIMSNSKKPRLSKGSQNDEKPFQCKNCSKRFPNHKNLLFHERLLHTYENSYKCNMCAKTFVLSEDLKNHLTTHSGEKPFWLKSKNAKGPKINQV